jgi:hypothetical protein
LGQSDFAVRPCGCGREEGPSQVELDESVQLRTPVLESGRRDSNRDPHLGKVLVFIRFGLAGPTKCGSVHPVSSPAHSLRPCSRALYYGLLLG